MKVFLNGVLVVAFFALVLTGCSGVRKNVSYFPVGGTATKMSRSIEVIILPVTDQRESAKIYPKQIIAQTSYYGDKSFDINDKPVDQVFEDALSIELYNLGVNLVKADIDMPLDKQTKDKLKEEITAAYPDSRVAIGMKVLNFMGESKRNFFTTDVRFTAAVELDLLDLQTGELLWSDYKTERTDTVMLSAGRNYMVDQLDGVLADVMRKAVRDNLSLRDALVKAANR